MFEANTYVNKVSDLTKSAMQLLKAGAEASMYTESAVTSIAVSIIEAYVPAEKKKIAERKSLFKFTAHP